MICAKTGNSYPQVVIITCFSTLSSRNVEKEGIYMFWDNFYRICKEHETSPSAVCREIGLSPNRSTHWKSNGTLPKEDELEALASALNCRVSEFFVDNVTRYKSEIAALERAYAASGESELDVNEHELITIYRKLDRKKKAMLMVAAYDIEDGTK